MTESQRLLLKLLSILLLYPDELLMSGLSDLEEFSDTVSEKSAELIGRRFLPYLQGGPLLRAQECYTRTFDLSPENSLYLTWHRFGDGKERGAALASLRGIYRDNDCECVSTDLPDYLPMLLEFASICPDDSGLEVLRHFGPEIEKIHLHLQKSDSPYASLFALLTEAVAAPPDEEKRSEDELE
jgi:nitrate reductase delta subunit